MQTISIGNSMVSSAIWEKHSQVSFSKTPELHESEGRVITYIGIKTPLQTSGDHEYIEDQTIFVDYFILVKHFALLLQIFALLFVITCTKIDQSQSSIISMCIISI